MDLIDCLQEIYSTWSTGKNTDFVIEVPYFYLSPFKETYDFFTTTVISAWMTLSNEGNDFSIDVVVSDFGTIFFSFENAEMKRAGQTSSGNWCIRKL